jgi:imidazolonepropionase-like amidohydrolase
LSIQIQAGTVITSDETVYDDGAVSIVDGEIAYVGPVESAPTQDHVDEYILPEHTLLPGLIDGHVHLGTSGDEDLPRDTLRSSPTQRTVQAIENARATVNAGFTTVRDTASMDDVAVTVRDAVAAGTFHGPRILAAGNGLLRTGGHGVKRPWFWPDAMNDFGRWRVADGVDEVQRAVREQLELGADYIKVFATTGVTDPDNLLLEYSPEEIRALIAEADRHGVDVAAHAHPPEGIKLLVDAGVRSIEHGAYMDDEAIEKMADNDVYVTLTRSMMTLLLEWDNSLYPILRDEKGAPSNHQANAKAALDHQASKIPFAHEKGIIAMGSDTGGPWNRHGDNADELVQMVEAGLDPLEVIRISTHNTASMLRLGDRVGQLREGYEADLIAVAGDPTADISIFTDPANVELVMVGGDLVKNEID